MIWILKKNGGNFSRTQVASQYDMDIYFIFEMIYQIPYHLMCWKYVSSLKNFY